jgi:hypothetical protein
MTREAALDELLDKQAIHEVVLRYCRGVDRMDRELVRSCYHDDAVDHHGNFEGGVEELLDWMWQTTAKFDISMHLLGNQLIELHGDVARVETYGIAFHRGDPDKRHRNLTNGFRYIDRFERRDGEWKIAQRVVVTEWTRVDDPADWWPVGDDFPKGVRGPDDLIRQPFEVPADEG